VAYIGKPPNTAIVNQATSQSFSGNGSTTAFTLTRSVNVGEDLEVFVNNVQQEPGSGKSYTASGTTLTFDEAPPSGTNNVYVIYRGEATINPRLEHDANAALSATTGTFSGDVGIGETVPVTPLTIATTNKLGSTFTGNTNGEGLTVTQTDYTSGNYVSLVEAAYDDSNDANPNVRIGAMFDGGGSNLAFGTSNNYGTGITNTAMFINSSGAVTVANGLTVDDDGATVLTVDRATSDGTVIDVQKDGTSVGLVGTTASDLCISSNNVGLRFDGSNNHIIPVNDALATRDNAIDIGYSGGRIKDLYLGGGAYIGGTGAANYLDDIEEGTFTATLNGGSTHPSTRLTTTGYFTKVNQMVHIGINFNDVTTTSYSGSISVFGLPFTCGQPGRQVFTIGSYFMASFSSSVATIFGHLSVTGTEIYLLGIKSGDNWETINHSAGSGRYLQINGAYRAA
jgi:sorbitol-specific phosphotransferase system component IIA